MIKGIYLVGGALRDQLMGIESKDIDYCFIADSYEEMRDYLLENGCEIYLEKPEYYAIRCNWRGLGPVDCVLGRKDGFYSDCRRPDSVELCSSIEEEMQRRDFTCNAIASDIFTGDRIDPFGGVDDINHRFLRTVGNPRDRFKEDGLRVMRAIRFAITKEMLIESDLFELLTGRECIDYLQNVSNERIREELFKMFKHDTHNSIRILDKFRHIADFIFNHKGNMWLKPTMEQR